MRATFILAALAGLLTASYAADADTVPPVPASSLEGVAPEVRDAVLAAHSRALAEPENGQASGRLGMVLQANTLYPQAVLAYQRAIRLEPGEFAWQYYLALTLQEMSKLEEAVDQLAAALRVRPDYAAAVLKRGELLFELGRFEESNATLEPLLANHPRSPEVLYALARVKYAQEKLPAAEDLYRRASQAYPAFGAAYYGLAVTGKRLGHDAESAKNFELAERYKDAAPHDGDPLREQMLDLGASFGIRIRRALTKVQQGEVEEASRLFQEILKQDPYNLDSLLGVLFLGPIGGRPSQQEMETFYERARQIAPENPQLYMYYGALLRNYGNNDAVITALSRAIELKPDYAPAHTLLGAVLEEEKRPDQAIEHYRLALAGLPSYRLARVQLTQLLVKKGHYREAIPELHRVVEVDDAATSISMVYLAIAYFNSGDAEKARHYLKQAQTRVEESGPPALLQEIEQIEQRIGQPDSPPLNQAGK